MHHIKVHIKVFLGFTIPLNHIYVTQCLVHCTRAVDDQSGKMTFSSFQRLSAFFYFSCLYKKVIKIGAKNWFRAEMLFMTGIMLRFSLFVLRHSFNMVNLLNGKSNQTNHTEWSPLLKFPQNDRCVFLTIFNVLFLLLYILYMIYYIMYSILPSFLGTRGAQEGWMPCPLQSQCRVTLFMLFPPIVLLPVVKQNSCMNLACGL